jgi:carbohydrate-selective porin OprB
MRFTQSFEITKWDQSAYDESGDITLGRATVGKNFTSGELQGTSAAELLMVGTEAGPAAYTAVERFTGTLSGTEGEFVMLHGATADQDASHGSIVAASGGLAGLTGTVLYEHDDKGPRLTLDYELA